jgi:hypothetical protein
MYLKRNANAAIADRVSQLRIVNLTLCRPSGRITVHRRIGGADIQHSRLVCTPILTTLTDLTGIQATGDGILGESWVSLAATIHVP